MKNLELAEKTMQYIKDHPDDHHQGVVTHCGAPGCFAGWLAYFDGMDMRQLSDYRSSNSDHDRLWRDGAAAYLQDALDITEDETCSIFSPANTIPMLELMIKDLANDGQLRDYSVYEDEARSSL
jgi:hypothetical protein